MLSFFGFGKKKRTSKSNKPSARVLRLCKKHNIKTTTSASGTRVYRKEECLKKECARKVNELKKLSSAISASARTTARKSAPASKPVANVSAVYRARATGGSPLSKPGVVAANKAKAAELRKLRSAKAAASGRNKLRTAVNVSKAATRMQNVAARGTYVPPEVTAFGFGKGRPVKRSVSKAAAMKAFRSFYRRHCSFGSDNTLGCGFGQRYRVRRRTRFGLNPPLSQSMGVEFCTKGGGVLGKFSTGLYATPCMSNATHKSLSRKSSTLRKLISKKQKALGKLGGPRAKPVRPRAKPGRPRAKPMAVKAMMAAKPSTAVKPMIAAKPMMLPKSTVVSTGVSPNTTRVTGFGYNEMQFGYPMSFGSEFQGRNAAFGKGRGSRHFVCTPAPRRTRFGFRR